MGMAIADLVATSDDLSGAGIWARHPEKVTSAPLPEAAYIGSDLHRLLAESDVLIDFSLPAGTETAAAASSSAVRLVTCC